MAPLLYNIHDDPISSYKSDSHIDNHNYGVNETNGTNGTSESFNNCKPDLGLVRKFEPIAICGMACRLPGGIDSPQSLWNFLIEGKDGRVQIPNTRFNSKGFYSALKRPSTLGTEYGYFLDESVDLAALDTSFFSMGRSEVEKLDPQQRLLLEVARESLEDAGEVGWEGSTMGVYVGSFGQDWSEICTRDEVRSGAYTVTCSHDFMISERISHEMDLHGPRYASLTSPKKRFCLTY